MEAKGIFDHCPLFLTLAPNEQRGKRSFKFSNMWTHHDDFIPIVKKYREVHVNGTYMFSVVQKLKALKKDLRNLNKEQFGDVELKYYTTKELLRRVQDDLHHNPTDSSFQHQERKISKEYKQNIYDLEAF